MLPVWPWSIVVVHVAKASLIVKLIAGIIIIAKHVNSTGFRSSILSCWLTQSVKWKVVMTYLKFNLYMLEGQTKIHSVKG